MESSMPDGTSLLWSARHTRERLTATRTISHLASSATAILSKAVVVCPPNHVCGEAMAYLNAQQNRISTDGAKVKCDPIPSEPMKENKIMPQLHLYTTLLLLLPWPM